MKAKTRPRRRFDMTPVPFFFIYYILFLGPHGLHYIALILSRIYGGDARLKHNYLNKFLYILNYIYSQILSSYLRVFFNRVEKKKKYIYIYLTNQLNQSNSNRQLVRCARSNFVLCICIVIT